MRIVSRDLWRVHRWGGVVASCDGVEVEWGSGGCGEGDDGAEVGDGVVGGVGERRGCVGVWVLGWGLLSWVAWGRA